MTERCDYDVTLIKDDWMSFLGYNCILPSNKASMLAFALKEWLPVFLENILQLSVELVQPDHGYSFPLPHKRQLSRYELTESSPPGIPGVDVGHLRLVDGAISTLISSNGFNTRRKNSCCN